MTDLDIFIENCIMFRIKINNEKIRDILCGDVTKPIKRQNCILMEQHPNFFINRKKLKYLTVDDKYKFHFEKTDNPKEILVPRGLLSFLEKKMIEFKISHTKHFTIADMVDLENAKKIKEMDVWKILKDNYLADFVQNRYYQTELLKSVLFRRNCLISLGTGAGKSGIMYYIITLITNYLKTSQWVLVIIPELVLLEQLPASFLKFSRDDLKEDMSYRLHKLGDKHTFKKLKLNEDKNIVVASYQSLVRREVSWFSKFSTIICDEVHKSPCSSIQTILKRCTNAKYRIGLTATLPDGYNGKVIQSLFGDVVYEKNEGELMEEGFLAPIDIHCINWKYVNNLLQLKTMHKAELDDEVAFIKNNYDKLSIYKYIMKNFVTEKDNTIILFKNLDVLYFTYMYFRHNFPDKKCTIIHATQNMNQITKFDDSRKYMKYLTYLDYDSENVATNLKKIFAFTKLKNIGQFDKKTFPQLVDKCEQENKLDKLEPFVNVLIDTLKDLFTNDSLKNIFRKKDLLKFLKGKADLYFGNDLFDECVESLNTVHTKNRNSDIDIFRDTVGNFMFAIDTTVNTGLDVDNFHVGILGQNIKAEARLIQGVGRFVRPQEDKLARWIDINDDLSHIGVQGGFNKNTAYEHSIARKEHYVKHGYTYSETSLNIDELEL